MGWVEGRHDEEDEDKDKDKVEKTETDNATRENPTYINIRFIYIDSSLSIVNADSVEKYTLFTYNDKSIFSRENILHIIQKHKINNSDPKKKYTLSKILLYNINTEVVDKNILLNQLKNNIIAPFLHEIEFTDDIEIEPSIPQFHPYNCLYFMYVEAGRSTIKTKKNHIKKIQKTKKKIIKLRNDIQ